MIRQSSLLALVLILTTGLSLGQVPGGESAMSVRAAAMGGAASLGEANPATIWSNPAARHVAGASASVWRAGDHATGGAVAVTGNGLSVGLRTDSHSPGKAATRISVAASGEVFGFGIGAGASLVEVRGAENALRRPRLDLGLTRDIGMLIAGVSVLDLGQSAETGALRFNSDPVVRADVTMDPTALGPLDIAVAGFAERTDRTTRAGGGVEIGYWPVTGRTFRLLLGTVAPDVSQSPKATMGLSFSGDWLTLEYAYANTPAGPATHRFGLRWR